MKIESESQRPKGREGTISALNAAIEATKLAESVSSIAPAKAVFGFVRVLLTLIRDSTTNELDHAELGLFCADISRALGRGTNGKKPDELSQSVYGAIGQFSAIVADIQMKLVRWGKRNAVSRSFHAKRDEETIAAWKLDLDKVFRVFNKALPMTVDAAASDVRHGVTNTHTIASDVQNVANPPAIVSGVQSNALNAPAIVSDSHRNASKSPGNMRGQNPKTHASAPGESLPPLPRSTRGTISDTRHDVVTRTMVSDIHRVVVQGQEGSGSKHLSTQNSIPGESPPPPPRTFFGRDELVKEIIDLAENLVPVALIGAGGIGKTSIALTVLHHDRIKQRFGHHRRFIRCDRFPASHTHLLRRLSEVIGADVENPEDLTPLRGLLSSKTMVIVLDNAESILDPQVVDAQKIYAVVEELCQFNNICTCITSRISTTPPDCKRLDVPTLPMDAAHDTFYQIYGGGDRSDLVNGILKQLAFHPLSITLLATVAYQNRWDTNRLAREWERRRTSVLQTQHTNSLATTIELSLASPLFQGLGPDARALLGIVAFFPQGVDENNLEWLFPTIPNRTDVFDKFCILSLTYRSKGFIMMLAPLRDYLSPKDPGTSPLLCATKDHYFARLSVAITPRKPNFGETQWITSEDVNVEHLLDIFTTVDGSDLVWSACVSFLKHLIWHKNRLTILKPKIEGLLDDCHFKPECFFLLSQLFGLVGNLVERKRLLFRVLELWREQGSGDQVALVLIVLSETDQLTGRFKEGIEQAKEELKLYEQLGNRGGQAICFIRLAFFLCSDKQLDAAEEAAFRAIDLLTGEDEENLVCKSHRALGRIYQSKGEIEKGIHHYEVAIGIASPFDWHDDLFWLHYELTGLFCGEDRLDDAQVHVEHAKSHTAHNARLLGAAVGMQAAIWYGQHRLEEARTEGLRAADTYGDLGDAEGVERCRRLVEAIEETLNTLAASGQPGFNGTE